MSALEDLGYSEISELDLVALREKNVLALQVTMEDLLAVYVFQRQT